MIKTYRKTATITAEQFDGSSAMIDKYQLELPRNQADTFKLGVGELDVGDWIVTENGESYPITDGVFKRTYAELAVIPKAVANLIDDYKSNKKIIDGLFTVLFEAGECGRPLDCADWINNHENLFARAWLDGYQVEGGKED